MQRDRVRCVLPASSGIVAVDDFKYGELGNLAGTCSADSISPRNLEIGPDMEAAWPPGASRISDGGSCHGHDRQTLGLGARDSDTNLVHVHCVGQVCAFCFLSISN